MPLFKKLDYGRLLYESLRNYFSVNTEGQMSILYRFCAALLFPLVGPFDAYDAIRRIYEIIANCKWQIGQLTNVLNYLFDPLLKRIFLTQSKPQNISAPEFTYPNPVQMQEFGGVAIQVREFNDRQSSSLVSINVPVGSDLDAITATVEQIKIAGIPYQIIEF